MKLVCVCIYIYIYFPGGFPGGASGKETTCHFRRHKTQVQSLGLEDLLAESMATHSIILA